MCRPGNSVIALTLDVKCQTPPLVWGRPDRGSSGGPIGANSPPFRTRFVRETEGGEHEKVVMAAAPALFLPPIGQAIT